MAISYSEDKGFEYHIHLKRGQIGRYVILTGDPGRCKEIAAYLDKPQKTAQNREYTTYTGYIEDELIAVTSTGIGGPSTAIAVEELINIGADTFIRVGTCGGYAEEVRAGDIVIATAAIKMGGTCGEYVPIEFPAAANHEITSALMQSAKKFNAKHHVGIVESKDSFYGQLLPDSMPLAKELAEKRAAYIAAGCLASEMEGATLFTVGGVRKARTGMILSVVGNQYAGAASPGIEEVRHYNTDLAVKIAIEATRSLIKA